MADAVLASDSGVLRSVEEVRALAACVPTEQEAKLLAAYARNQPSLAGLSDAEQLCIDLMRVRSEFRTSRLRFFREAWHPVFNSHY